MERQSWSVGFAAAVGALIGGLIAVDFAARIDAGAWLLVPGALLGACIAYVAVDFRHFMSGISRAWQRTINWRPDPQYLKMLVAAWFMMNAITLTLLSLIISLFLITGDSTEGIKVLTTLGLVLEIAMQTMGFLMFGALMSVIPKEKQEEQTRGLWRMAKYGNPIGLPFAIVFGVQWSIAALNAAWPKIIAYFREALYQVHSERRRMAFSGALLGVVIGFFFGSAIIGALAGAIIGVVEHELIAVRLLKIRVK
jgi:uncharacterized protein YqgC (DUF456 family)